MSAPFFTRRIYLDNTVKRGEKLGGEFYFGPFKSFWVSATNNANFSAEMVVNYRDNSDRGLPLRLNQCQAFGDKVDNCVIEVPTAQPGVWIDITFSQEEVLSVGSVAVTLQGVVSETEGSTSPQSKVTLPLAGTVTAILTSNDQRTVARFQYKSGDGTLYIGSPAELNDADYANICKHVTLSGSGAKDFEHRGTGSMSAKIVGATVDAVFSLTEEIR